jgi:hypothetical protein
MSNQSRRYEELDGAITKYADFELIELADLEAVCGGACPTGSCHDRSPPARSESHGMPGDVSGPMPGGGWTKDWTPADAKAIGGWLGGPTSPDDLKGALEHFLGQDDPNAVGGYHDRNLGAGYGSVDTSAAPTDGTDASAPAGPPDDGPADDPGGDFGGGDFGGGDDGGSDDGGGGW